MVEGNLPAASDKGTLLGAKVIAAAAMIMGVILASAIFVAGKLYDQTVFNARRELSSVSRLTAERTSQSLSAADLLARSAQDLVRDAAVADQDAFRERARTRIFFERLINLKTLLPQVDVVAVAGADGELLSSSRRYPAPEMTIDLSGLAANFEKHPSSLVIIGPRRAPTGSQMLYLLRSLTDKAGRFIGIALVGVPVSYIERYFSTIHIDGTQVMGLTTADDTLAASWPKRESLTGKPVTNFLPRTRELRDTSAGLIRGDDRISRVFAVSRVAVADTSLWLSVTLATQSVLKPWRDALVWIGAFAMLTLLIVAALTFSILRAMREEAGWRRALVERETMLSRQATDLVLARDQAEAANRVRGEFLSHVSLELRTPLEDITTLSESLQKERLGPIADSRYLEYVSDIHDGGTHLLALVNNILDLMEVDSGRLRLDEQDVDLGDLTIRCGALMAGAARRDGIDLEVFGPERPVLLRGDPARLKQIILNLLSNAIKFTSAGQKVSLSFGGDHECAILRVADTGVGMTPEQLTEALLPFRQIDNSLTRPRQGAGIGLPLVGGLVTLHGGRMEIQSIFGAGTIVTVRLPKTGGAPMSSAAPQGGVISLDLSDMIPRNLPVAPEPLAHEAGEGC